MLVRSPIDGLDYSVSVPPGCGSEMEVELPDRSSPVTVTVTIPLGCAPGDAFDVLYEDRTFTVSVPPHVSWNWYERNEAFESDVP